MSKRDSQAEWLTPKVYKPSGVKTYRIGVMFDVTASSPYEAEDIVREKIRPAKEHFAYLFHARDRKPKGWLQTVVDQLAGK